MLYTTFPVGDVHAAMASPAAPASTGEAPCAPAGGDTLRMTPTIPPGAIRRAWIVRRPLPSTRPHAARTEPVPSWANTTSSARVPEAVSAVIDPTGAPAAVRRCSRRVPAEPA